MITNLLIHFQKGGFLLILISLVCFGILFIFFKNWFHLNALFIKIPEMIRKNQLLKSEDSSDIFNNFKKNKVKSLSNMKENSILGVEQMWVQEEYACQRDLHFLSALVTSAPLLGLLGTILGMTQTFGVLSQDSTNTSMLISLGIHQALITTKYGLVVALPGVFAVVSIKKKLAQLEILFLKYEHHLKMILRLSNEKTD